MFSFVFVAYGGVETLNVWTHLLGSFAFGVLIVCSLMTWLEKELSDDAGDNSKEYQPDDCGDRMREVAFVIDSEGVRVDGVGDASARFQQELCWGLAVCGDLLKHLHPVVVTLASVIKIVRRTLALQHQERGRVNLGPTNQTVRRGPQERLEHQHPWPYRKPLT